MTPEQCRAARLLLRWDQKTLCAKTGLGRGVISLFESGTQVRPVNVRTIKAALNESGVTFVNTDREIGVILALPPEGREDKQVEEADHGQPTPDRPEDSAKPRELHRLNSQGRAQDREPS